MHWIAPTEKDAVTEMLEERLWDTADQFRRRNCEVRSPKCEVRPVRQSKFDIRHSPRLWIQLFHSALNEKGRAGFVMATGGRNGHSCAMKITEDVHEYTTEPGMED